MAIYDPSQPGGVNYANYTPLNSPTSNPTSSATATSGSQYGTGARTTLSGGTTGGTTAATGTTGTTDTSTLRDMSGQYFAGRLIPQGWSMDQNGNWVNTGAASTDTSTGGDRTVTLPSSYVTTAYNPSETSQNLLAGGYTQQPNGTWTNSFQNVYGGLLNNPQQTQTQTQPAPYSAPQNQPTSQDVLGNGIGNSIYTGLQQYLRQLFGPGYNFQNPAPSYGVNTTPLGYTQWQQQQTQQGGANQLLPIIMSLLAGQQQQASPNYSNFWSFGGGNPYGQQYSPYGGLSNPYGIGATSQYSLNNPYYGQGLL